MRTDAEILRTSRDHPDAFVEIFDRHFDAIFGFLARRVGRELGSDLAAETFARAFAARSRFDLRRQDARPWLFGIAANLVRRHVRDEERRLAALARLGVPADDRQVDEPVVAEALLALERDEREVLFLVAWADLTYEHIAEVLEVPVGTVRSRLHRARARVREAVRALEVLDG